MGKNRLEAEHQSISVELPSSAPEFSDPAAKIMLRLLLHVSSSDNGDANNTPNSSSENTLP